MSPVIAFSGRNERKDVSGARFQAGRQYENIPRMQTSMQTKYAKPPTMALWCRWACGVVVSMFDFHRSDRGSNPGRGGEFS